MKSSNPAVPCKIVVAKFNLSSLNTNLVPLLTLFWSNLTTSSHKQHHRGNHKETFITKKTKKNEICCGINFTNQDIMFPFYCVGRLGVCIYIVYMITLWISANCMQVQTSIDKIKSHHLKLLWQFMFYKYRNDHFDKLERSASRNPSVIYIIIS